MYILHIHVYGYGTFIIKVYSDKNYNLRTPLHKQYVAQGQFLSSLTNLNSELSLSENSYHTQIKEPNLPSYLSTAEQRIIGGIPFLSILVLCIMQAQPCQGFELGFLCLFRITNIKPSKFP